MSELKTEELTEILKQTTDIDVFLDDNELLPNVSLAEYINELVEEKKTKLRMLQKGTYEFVIFV